MWFSEKHSCFVSSFPNFPTSRCFQMCLQRRVPLAFQACLALLRLFKLLLEKEAGAFCENLNLNPQITFSRDGQTAQKHFKKTDRLQHDKGNLLKPKASLCCPKREALEPCKRRVAAVYSLLQSQCSSS